MAAKSNPRTALHGANVERDCIRRKVRRLRSEQAVSGTNAGAVLVLDDLLKWIDNRSVRYARKPGGLGTKKAK